MGETVMPKKAGQYDVKFSKLLNARAEELQFSLRDIALSTGFTYEHVRKVFNGGSFPSRLMLQELCKLLGLNLKHVEQIVISDRIQCKYGRQLPSFAQNSQLTTTWSRLTDDQRSSVLMLINGYARQNELRKAG